MEIDFAAMLHNSDVMLLFTALAFGLMVGRIKIGGFELGSTTGVLLAALCLGNWGFNMSTQTESLGFMLFIFCVGIEAGPNFFSTFVQDGVRYVGLAIVVALTGILVAVGVSGMLDLDSGMSAGMLAGSLTSTPTLVGAQDAVANRMTELTPAAREVVVSQISVGYALTYVVGLVGVTIIIGYFPTILRINLVDEARKVARERGLDKRRRVVRTPLLRAYEVGEDTAATIAGRTLRELGLFEQFGILVERIKRDGELIEPNSETVLQLGDRVALVGYPSSHSRSEAGLREEVFDPELLQFEVTSAEIVVNNSSAVDKPLKDLKLQEEYGCFAEALTRTQIDMPVNPGMVLQRGDLLTVSGEKTRLTAVAGRLGFINLHSDVSDLVTFSCFFILGLMFGQLELVLGELQVGLGNAGGLLLSGILMGYYRAQRPTFGYIPQGAINMLKDLGLNIFMVSIGLSAGAGIIDALMQNGPVIILCSLVIMLTPLIVGFLFGHYVLKLNAALLLGGITGAMTSTPALKTIIESSKSNIPALGYAGTYAFANVFLTLGGAVVVML